MSDSAVPSSGSDRSIERSSDLVVASVYEREVGASLTRVWENVYDWAHLPYLHSQAFRSIEKLDAGPWGWHARIGLGGESTAEIELELVVDKPAQRYVSRTLVGPAGPSEIWTQLDPIAEDRTAIRVEFCVAQALEPMLDRIGRSYVELYTLLWDQDEDMMQTRESALAEVAPPPSTSASSRSQAIEHAGGERHSLGSADSLRQKLPCIVEFRGQRFRLVEVDGKFFAHGIQCPHLLGPLTDADVVDGTIACPWHGYVFDVRTGKSCDGRRLALDTAPAVSIDVETGDVVLLAEAAVS